MGWNDYKQDCFFFDEEIDMGAIVHTCKRYEQYGYCPCQGCEGYRNRVDVFRAVVEHDMGKTIPVEDRDN